jgi:hypothetical protein
MRAGMMNTQHAKNARMSGLQCRLQTRSGPTHAIQYMCYMCKSTECATGKAPSQALRRTRPQRKASAWSLCQPSAALTGLQTRRLSTPAFQNYYLLYIYM